MMLKQAPFRPFGQVSSGGSGNATVPDDAPIQPPQAFVDNIRFSPSFDGTGLDLHSKGITHISSSLLYGDTVTPPSWARFARVFESDTNVKLNGNALPESDVNSILAAAVSFDVSYGPGLAWSLDLSGGTNAAPTGQGLTDKATLIGAGWTVTTN
jgi:hypothetical protein